MKILKCPSQAASNLSPLKRVQNLAKKKYKLNLIRIEKQFKNLVGRGNAEFEIKNWELRI